MSALNRVIPSITDQIRFDHTQVLAAFHQYTPTASTTARQALADTICDLLEIHAVMEKEILYPVLHLLHPTDPNVLKIEPETDEVCRLIAQVRAARVGNPRHEGLFFELMRDVLHHVADEETKLLPEVDRLLSKERLEELGAAFARRHLELARPKAGKLVSNAVTGFSSSTTVMAAGAALAVLAGRALAKKIAVSSDSNAGRLS